MKYQIFELRRKIQGYGFMFDYRSYAHHLSSCEIKGWRINAVFISFSKVEIYILYIHLYLHDLREYFEVTAWPALSRRGSQCPFSKRSMPFSRQVENVSTINNFFTTNLKKKENMQLITQYRTWNFCFLTSLLLHYTTRLIRRKI